MSVTEPHQPNPRTQRAETESAASRVTDARAQSFRLTRDAHRAEIAEDYVELIAELSEGRGEARIVDIAERLGVSHVSVSKAVARLQREGLVQRQPYRAIFLTEAGRELAKASRERHELVVSFLMALGVSEEAARHDAEGIEHHVCAETLDAFRRHLRPSGDRA